MIYTRREIKYILHPLRRQFDLFMLTRNMGTSVQMIQQYYGSHVTAELGREQLRDYVRVSMICAQCAERNFLRPHQMSDNVQKRQLDRLRRMNYFRWVSFLVVAIPVSVLAATDPACMQRCQNSGSNREYCESVCTYKSQLEAGAENSGYHMYLDNESIFEPMKRAQEYRLGKERAQLESERIALERMRIASEREKLQRKGGESASADDRAAERASTNALWQSYLSFIPNQAYGEWLTNAMPRIPNFGGPFVFFQKVLKRDVIISTGMLDRIKSSKYAADLAWYFANNYSESELVSNMPTAQMGFFIDDLETKFEK